MRMKFVFKVYWILFWQVLFTFGCVAASMHTGFSEYFKTLGWRGTAILLGVAALNFLLTTVVFCCFPGLLRKNPWKWIILAVFTLCNAFIVMVAVVNQTPGFVYAIMGVTLLIFGVLTAFAMQCKHDFTGMFFILFYISLGLLAVVFFCFFLQMFIGEITWLEKLFASLYLLLSMAYIVVETQMIMGNGEHKLAVDDYVLGALMLYMDIIQMFVSLITLFGN